MPRANYPQSAYDIDAFVWSHPDLLVVFNTGNLGQVTATPLSSLSAPGSAKNTLQIGGTRRGSNDDNTLAYFTLFGLARDGDQAGPRGPGARSGRRFRCGQQPRYVR